MTAIDYEALAKAGYTAYWGSEKSSCWTASRKQKSYWEPTARAVVAAYDQQMRDQGLVVVRREDVAAMEHDILENAGAEWETTYREVVPDLYDAVTRVGAALAATAMVLDLHDSAIARLVRAAHPSQETHP